MRAPRRRSASPGEVAANLARNRTTLADLRWRSVEDPVQVVGRDLAGHPAYEVALDVGQGERGIGRGSGLPLDEVEHHHQQRVGGLRAPGAKPLQGGSQVRGWLARGMQDAFQVPRTTSQFDNLLLESSLVIGSDRLQPLLLRTVDLRLLDPLVPADHPGPARRGAPVPERTTDSASAARRRGERLHPG